MSQLDKTIKKIFRDIRQIHTTSILRLLAEKYPTIPLHTRAVHRLHLNAACNVIQKGIFQMTGKFSGKFHWKILSQIRFSSFVGKPQQSTTLHVSSLVALRESEKRLFEYRLL
jgi:hypothetical protein